MQDKWTGPYIVHKKLDNGCYKLRTEVGKVLKQAVNEIRLKLLDRYELIYYVLYDRFVNFKICSDDKFDQSELSSSASSSGTCKMCTCELKKV